MDFLNLQKYMDLMSEVNPGNAVRIYLGGKAVFQYASGYSDLENRIQMTGEEMFNIYSCSKIATVTAGMQLVEQGKILLTDPLYDYMPEFRKMYVKSVKGDFSEAQNPILVRDLFTMTAGFDYDYTKPAFQRAAEVTKGRMDTVDTIRCLAEEPLCFEPGTRWNYSICHDVLAALVSVVSGKKFRDYVTEHIFEPLEMHESYYHHTQDTLRRTAQQYWFEPESDGELDPVEVRNYGSAYKGTFKNLGKNVIEGVLGEEYDCGGAGIVTTISDYVKLLAALANWGMGLNGEKILSRYVVELMRTNQLDDVLKKDYNWSALKGYGYGLGVRVHMDPVKSGCISNLGEFGWSGAAGATAIIDPEINLAVFHVRHCLNARGTYYQPRLKNAVYSCL